MLKSGGGYSARISRFGWATNDLRSHHEDVARARPRANAGRSAAAFAASVRAMGRCT
jgi:hypothetical protein